MPPLTRRKLLPIAWQKKGKLYGKLPPVGLNWDKRPGHDPTTRKRILWPPERFSSSWDSLSGGGRLAQRSSFRSFLWISFPNKELQMCIKFHSHFFQRMLPHLRAMNPKLTARSRFGLPGCHWMVPGSESVLGSQMGKVITMGFHRMKSWSWKVHYKLVKDQFVDSSNDLWEKER